MPSQSQSVLPAATKSGGAPPHSTTQAKIGGKSRHLVGEEEMEEEEEVEEEVEVEVEEEINYQYIRT